MRKIIQIMPMLASNLMFEGTRYGNFPSIFALTDDGQLYVMPFAGPPEIDCGNWQKLPAIPQDDDDAQA